MEFGISEAKFNLNITWNGPTEILCRKLVTSYTLKSTADTTHHLKLLMFYPRMPTNHVTCILERFRRSWFNKVGIAARGARKAMTALSTISEQDFCVSDDKILIKVMEEIGLDDVATDIDLIAIKKFTIGGKSTSIWAFGFSPDDLGHFLENVRVNGDMMCYGRNGDPDLN